MDDFSKNPDLGSTFQSRLQTEPKTTNFEFQREDWVSFRTVEGLQQKAGVNRSRLRRLVFKELVDNALDVGRAVNAGRLGVDGFFVEDDGCGIDGTPEDIARRFSVIRPMISSKLLRLPTRGALGNGLRVVVGAVLASGGSLVVITRNRWIALRPETDGSTTVVESIAVDHPVGTRIEITLGNDIPRGGLDDLQWGRLACQTAKRTASVYAGKTSPFWYDVAQFHELFLASGSRPVRELISEFEGCSGSKAGSIVKAAGLGRVMCADVSRDQALQLLDAARSVAREVKPERLGMVGDNLSGHYHCLVRGVTAIGSSFPKADIPFVVEAWAAQAAGDGIELTGMVNRTPIVTDVQAYRSAAEKTKLRFYGCGLLHNTEGLPAKGGYKVLLNISTPFCPITSDGKAPDLTPFVDHIAEAVIKAIGMAKRAAPKERKVSQKDVILEHLDDAIEKASGGGEYRFNERQVFYVLRDAVRETTGRELIAAYFSSVITEYESEHGEIEGMYREPRGSLLHPHSEDGQIALGTLMVADYERPAWTFNKLLYIEKEGFTEILKTARWPERHDCALMSSKGFTTRAARDLVDKMAEHDEAITVFCVHDADASGSMIYQTFQEATKAREARKVKIINLGLEPWEALAMGLASEAVEESKRNRAVADYITKDAPADYTDWAEWLQTNRVELNAMTAPQLIEWLDSKMAKHAGKLIPPEKVLVADLDERIRNKVRVAVRDRILREAGFEQQVDLAVAAIDKPERQALVNGIEHLFKRDQARSWRDHIEAVATAATKATGQ